MAKSDIPAGQNQNLILRGQRYWCRYTPTQGRPEVRIPLHTTDVKKARKARDELIARVEDVRAGRAPAIAVTWDLAIEEYIAFQATQVKNGSISAKTAQRYAISIRNLSEILEGHLLESTTSATVMSYVQARQARGISASTIKNDLTAWSKVLSFAQVKTLVTTNPAKDFDRAQFIGRDEDAVNPPNDDEVKALELALREWKPEWATLVVWLRETGMRLQEALSAHAEDVHPGGKKITLKRGVKRNKKSGQKTRTINLGLASALLPLLAQEGRLFGEIPESVNRTSSRFSQWKRERSEFALKTKQPLPDGFRLHDLRHAFAIASLLDDQTCIYGLKMHLGHGSVTTTEGYVRFLQGEGAQRQYHRRPDLYGSLSSFAQNQVQSPRRSIKNRNQNGR